MKALNAVQVSGCQRSHVTSNCAKSAPSVSKGTIPLTRARSGVLRNAVVMLRTWGASRYPHVKRSSTSQGSCIMSQQFCTVNVHSAIAMGSLRVVSTGGKEGRS